ncbi:DUF7884 domain-containing protein [Sulfitobacter sp. M13]
MKTGTLTLTFPDASSCQFGSGDPFVAATITSARSLQRITLNPDLATGEAYMRDRIPAYRTGGFSVPAGKARRHGSVDA